MDPIRFERAQRLFDAASRLPETDRHAYLQAQAADDAPLVAEVLELLGHHAQAKDSLLGRLAVGPTGAAERADTDPTDVGPYRILGRLGEGGMGVVYLAEQTEPIRRQVAVKLVKAGMDTAAVLARFARERQALAMMDHDAIAKVFDCGSDERGRPYFVMELVRGVPIDAYCEVHRIPLTDRLRLVQRICDAVQHAHQKGVVHRDLKPSNLLVVGEGSSRQVKVIDFGLARVLDDEAADASRPTMQERVLGTPEYMAPEQAGSGAHGVDTRADVYSLGVVLYELLVGELPFAFDALREKGVDEMRRVICEVDPPRPSERFSRSGEASAGRAAARGVTPSGLLKVLRSDLDWVVAKALEKDRERRYASASALAEDLQRFLDHDPLVAGPPSAMYRLRKLARRYRAQFAVAATVLTTAIVGAVVAGRFAVEAEAARAVVASSLQDFELLAAVVNTQQAVQAAEGSRITWPDRAPSIDRWLDQDAERALRPQGEVEALLGRTAALPADGTRASHEEKATSARVFLTRTLEGAAGDMRNLRDEIVPSMRLRSQWARRQWQLSLQHPNARHMWQDVRQALARNPNYSAARIELTDADIVGLVPIGENPVTHYWEFYDLRTAWDGRTDPASIVIPQHEADGSIAVGEATGMVFVLLPGGEARIGEGADERVVTLEPFFCARHEMTRGQWFRLAGTAPFYYPYALGHHDDRPVFDDCPAESISWIAAAKALVGIGCSLPTEAQWEYACRAGSRTAWWSGSDPELLQGCANLADRTWASTHPPASPSAPITDGWSMLAPVGSFRANAFGLFDVHGNVIEWCGNDYEKPTQPQITDLDGCFTKPPTYVPMRGGFASAGVEEARCSKRDFTKPDFSNPVSGLRAVRLAKHPWRERLVGLDAAKLAAQAGAWPVQSEPHVQAGRWQIIEGRFGAGAWEEQINVSDTGCFVISGGAHVGARGTVRHRDGTVLLESETFVERWTQKDGDWQAETWPSVQAMHQGQPPEGFGYVEFVRIEPQPGIK